MLVIRDALLSQLQKDRLRQEIILAELAKIEHAMVLHNDSRHGISTDDVEWTKQFPSPSGRSPYHTADGPSVEKIMLMWMRHMILRKRMGGMGV